MEQLAAFIRSKTTIADTDLEKIIACFKERRIKKDRFLLKQGQVAGEYIFVQSGGLRIFFEQEQKTITAWLALENTFFAELAGIRTQQPSRFNIQAIEDSVLLTISKADMNMLYDIFPKWQEFGRQIWETAFLQVIDGFIAFQTMSAEERYRMAMQQGDWLQRLPLKDISSFLGITPNSLSRIRKKIK